MHGRRALGKDRRVMRVDVCRRLKHGCVTVAWVGTAMTVAIALWIILFSPDMHAALRGLAVLACSLAAVVVAVLLWGGVELVNQSIALQTATVDRSIALQTATVLQGMAQNPQRPALKLVERDAGQR